MSDIPNSEYAQFMHLTHGLRAGVGEGDRLKIWPTGKSAVTEITNLGRANWGAALTTAGLEVIGNEDRLWSDGYEERIWNPALILGVGNDFKDLPGHDWSDLAYALEKHDYEKRVLEIATGASMHLRGASLRLMHISEWYHQMLLYAHLKGYSSNKYYSNLDTMHALLDCHSFLTELASARDYISSFAGMVVAGLKNVDNHSKILKRLKDLPAELAQLVQYASEPSRDRLTLAHIGRYRDIITHERPLASMGKGLWQTFELGINLPHALMGVKFDIRANPLSDDDRTFDCLRALKSMMRVVFEYSRAIIAISPVKPQTEVIKPLNVRRIPMTVRPFPSQL